MPGVPGTAKINVEFFLTPEQELHCFAQWRELNPSISLDHFNTKRYKDAVRDILARIGWQAITNTLPDHIELKKMDYKAALKGIVA